MSARTVVHQYEAQSPKLQTGAAPPLAHPPVCNTAVSATAATARIPRPHCTYHDAHSSKARSNHLPRRLGGNVAPKQAWRKEREGGSASQHCCNHPWPSVCLSPQGRLFLAAGSNSKLAVEKPVHTCHSHGGDVTRAPHSWHASAVLCTPHHLPPATSSVTTLQVSTDSGVSKRYIVRYAGVSMAVPRQWSRYTTQREGEGRASHTHRLEKEPMKQATARGLGTHWRQRVSPRLPIDAGIDVESDAANSPLCPTLCDIDTLPVLLLVL